MFKEFKAFIMRGNVVDLAVGVVIGTAFGKIVTSFVEDILMPPIGRLTGRVDFSNLFISLSSQHYDTLAAAKAAGAPTLNYGVFLNNVVNFLIVGFAIFIVVKQVNRLRPSEPRTTRECPYCLMSIPKKATRCAHCTSQVTPA